jgi:hypothetical protein
MGPIPEVQSQNSLQVSSSSPVAGTMSNEMHRMNQDPVPLQVSVKKLPWTVFGEG